MQEVNDNFYADLAVSNLSLGALFARKELFYPFPADWHVIVTDIKNSTEAVFSGQHEVVNLVATGSIVAVLNIAFSKNLSIPFFFGGDGATFIVPATILEACMQALTLYKTNTLTNFNLGLRCGTVPVHTIITAGCDLRVSKFNSSSVFSIPVTLGDGLIYAEKLIKQQDQQQDTSLPGQELDLSGMQCRWDRIAPPEDKEEVVTLLILARDINRQAEVFGAVMNRMDALYGTPQKRQPISVTKLRLKTTFNRLSTEIKARLGRIDWLQLAHSRLLLLFGYLYFRTPKGKKYLKSLVDMSETLVIDGKINTVISGTLGQRKQLQAFLDEEEANGNIIYGMHISNASVMSCYVRNMEDGHVHFVDGAEGGYTKAAQMLKAKMSAQA